ncbi:MAG: site-specific DNA-methyltransferase, partial [Methylocystis sp.]|nr:site-specific DNA-methyltransferase [Methylocystis sp.]
MSAVEKLAETEFFHDLRWSAEFGAATRAVVADGVPYYLNAFWTAGQRRAHPLHEISYRACFKPQLPAFFIDRLTQP